MNKQKLDSRIIGVCGMMMCEHLQKEHKMKDDDVVMAVAKISSVIGRMSKEGFIDRAIKESKI
jgi:hypothetical protein